jgi:PAS domain S-box-containing protein
VLKFNLQKKFIALTSFVIILTAMLLSFYYLREDRKRAIEELMQKGQMLAHSLANSSEYDVMFSDVERLVVLIGSIALDEDVRYIVIYDDNGEVLTEVHTEPRLPYPRDAEMVKTFEKIQDHEDEIIITSLFYPGSGDILAFDITCPILTTRISRHAEDLGIMWEEEPTFEDKAEQVLLGRVRMGVSCERVFVELGNIQRNANILTAVVICLGVLLTIPLTRVLTNPLRQLMEATQRIAQGDLGRKVKVATSDEIGELGISFNQMVLELKSSRDEIEEYSRTLEAKVKGRTAELGKANESLESELKERRRAEEMLRTSEEKYRTIFEESKDVIFMSTPEGKLIDINPAGVELFGYFSKEEILLIDMGRDLYVNDDDRESFRRLIERQGFVKDYELSFKKKTGDRVIVLTTTVVVRNEDGDIVAYRGIMRDVTEHKQLEQQLLQVQKMESLGTLAGGIAHDFNNILGGILGYASLMKTKMTKDHQFFKYIDTIEKGGLRASELTSQLLGFARGGKYNSKPVDLNALIEETLGIVGRTFDKSIEIGTKFQKQLPAVEGDEGQLQQVLMNLCVNAGDAMPDGGRLTIETGVEMFAEDRSKTGTTAAAESYVVLSVIDTGIGMDKKTMERIFEPFFTTKEEGKGTGLGLAMVYGVVKNHGGFVNASSEPGQGTTFRIYMPASVRAQETHPVPSEAPRGENELILVVDDEEAMRSFAKEALEAHGYRVLIAENGVEAVETYRQHNGDIGLVILDLIMPKMGGHETFIKLKELNHDVKVILSTGYSQSGKAQEILDCGVLGFIQKPYQVNSLLAKIRPLLTKKTEMNQN